MSLPVWGNLEKSQIDPETIEEAIARLIQAHEDDPNAHLETGESLQSHKASEIIDHAVASIVADKIKDWEIVKLGGAFERTDFHWWGVFESLDGFSKDILRSGAITLNPTYVEMITGATDASYSLLRKEIAIMNVFTWAKKRKFRTRIHFGTVTNQGVVIATGDAASPPGTRLLGFYIFNNVISGWATNGSNQTILDLNTAAVAGVAYDLEMVWTPGEKVEFYINDILKGTITATLPSGVTDAQFLVSFYVANAEAANKWIRFSYWDFWQEI